MIGAGGMDSALGAQKPLGGQTDVLDDLPEQDRREIAGSVVQYRRLSAIGMAELPVRIPLADLREAQPFKNADGFPWLQDRQGAYSKLYRHGLGADKFSFEFWHAVFQEHLEHFPEVVAQFFQGFALGVRPWKTGHIAHVEFRSRASFHDCGKCIHAFKLP